MEHIQPACQRCWDRKVICDYLTQITRGEAWTSWEPLLGYWLREEITASPGLYCIGLKLSGRYEVVYVGESDKLSVRLGMFNGVFDPTQMPYRSPHTAGPALWALLDRMPTALLTASVWYITAPEHWRKGLECVAIALHRQRHRASPRVNFSRMPIEYRASSFNTLKLAQQQKRYRGGKSAVVDRSHVPGVAPIGSLQGDPLALDWGGHVWSAWQQVHLPIPYSGRGFYRLRYPDLPWLTYLGWGKVRDGIKRQVRQVPAAPSLLCSWSQGDWDDHQFEELHTDLIASHCLSTKHVPCWQFRRRRSDDPVCCRSTALGRSEEGNA